MRRVLAVLACVGVCAVAQARQQDRAPTPEERIARLQAELDRVRQERDELRVRLGEAIQMLRNLGYAPPAPMLAEPSDPMASPIAAMRTLRRRARLDLAGVPRDTVEDRAAYHKTAQEWVEKMNTALSGEKDWLVRVLGVDLPTSSSSAARATAQLQLYDASSGAPLSPPMEVSVPGRIGRRMAERLAGAGNEQAWMARVNLRPAVRHNPDRQEAGPFDHPPFLAPEVEATVGVEWLRFEPASVPEGFFPATPDADQLAVPRRSPDATPSEASDAAPPARQPR